MSQGGRSYTQALPATATQEEVCEAKKSLQIVSVETQVGLGTQGKLETGWILHSCLCKTSAILNSVQKTEKIQDGRNQVTHVIVFRVYKITGD